MPMILGKIGWLLGSTALTPPPEPGDWNLPDESFFTSVSVFVRAIFSTAETGWGGLTVRQLYSAPTVIIEGDYLRVLVASAINASATLGRMFVSTAPSAQTNFDASFWVPVLFNGDEGFTLAAGQTRWSDPVHLPGMGGVGAEQLLFSMHFSATSSVTNSAVTAGTSVAYRSGDTANLLGDWGSFVSWNRLPFLMGIEFGTLIENQHRLQDFSSFSGFDPFGVQVVDASYFSGYSASDNQLVEFDVWAEFQQ